MSLPIPPGVDLSTIPLMMNPNGDPPNFVNPPSQEAISRGVGLTFAIVSFLAVTLRCFSNYKFSRKLMIDDYLCIVGFLFMTAYLACGMTMHEVSRHSWDVPLSVLFKPSFNKSIFTFNFLSAPAIGIPKLAILALYMRLFQLERWFRVCAWATIALIVSFTISCMSVAAAACSAENGVWTLRMTCGTWMTKVGVVGGSIWVAVDVIIFCLPLPIILSLHLTPKKKIGVCFVFTTGLLAIICSIISLYYRVQIQRSPDTLWNGAIVKACAFAEGFITIIVSCTPAIYSFYSNIFVNSTFYSNIRSTFSRGKGSQSSSNAPSKAYAASDDSGSDKGFKNRPQEYKVDLKTYDGTVEHTIIAPPGAVAVGTEGWAGQQAPEIWKHTTFGRASVSVKETVDPISRV